MQGADVKAIKDFVQRSAGLIDKPLDAATLVYIMQISVLALVYFLTAKWGLTLSPVNGFATFVWPPTGIALTALLLMGYEMWPGIFIGAFSVNLLTGASPLEAVCIAAGNTAGPLTALYLLRRLGFDLKLERVKDVVLLVCCAVLFSTLISASIGATSLLMGGVIRVAAYPFTWITWWIGDALGILIITPLLLAWTRNSKFEFTTRKLIEAGALLVAFVGIGVVIFDAVPITDPVLVAALYLLCSFFIWAELRFSIRYITILIVVLSVMAIWSAKYGFGPFYSKSVHTSLFATQLFVAATAVTFLVFSSVISERRRAQATVQTLNARLQSALSQTTEKLREERALEKIRDEFVATASHELKTPVTSIKAYAQVLQKKLPDNKDNELSRLAAGINNQADVLTRRVNELLDVSKVVEGNITLNKSVFDMNSLLRRILADFEIVAQSHTLSLRGIIKNPVLADKVRVEQVVINLLTNAIKYSPSGSRISMRAWQDRSSVFISVRDRGPGIHKKDRIKIFKRFYRTGDETRNKQSVSGMGLGLYICSEIVKQHGGKLWVESELSVGSVFIFTLPSTTHSARNS